MGSLIDLAFPPPPLARDDEFDYTLDTAQGNPECDERGTGVHRAGSREEGHVDDFSAYVRHVFNDYPQLEGGGGLNRAEFTQLLGETSCPFEMGNPNPTAL